MNYQSQRLNIGRTWAKSNVAAFKTDPGAALIVTPKVRLSGDPVFNPTSDSTLASLVAGEAIFSGYTAGGYAPTFSDALNIAADVVGEIANVIPTLATATPLVTATVYGYWMDNGADVIVSEKFANGITFTFALVGDFLDLQIVIPVMLSQKAYGA